MTKASKTIHERMFAVMEAMEGKPILKDNKKGVPYLTLSHDKVTAAIRPLLIDNRIIPYASVIEHGQDGNLTSAVVEVRFQNVDDKDDFVLVQSFGYGNDNQDKGPGKAISYAVKYAYLKAFCLETIDDPENENIKRETAPPKPAPPPTFNALVTAEVKRLGKDMRWVKSTVEAKYDKSKASELTKQQQVEFVKYLQALPVEEDT